VHFDLQMKNVVAWSEPNDSFRRRLESRLRHVMKPLLRDQAARENAAAERAEFGRLSQSAQMERLKAKGVALLRSRGFSQEEPKRGSTFFKGASVESTALMARQVSGMRQEVVLLCRPTAIKRLFDAIEFRSFLPAQSVKGLPPTQTHYVVASLASVPRSRVTGALTGFSALDGSTYHQRTEIPGRHTVDAYVHVLSPIKSEGDFSSLLRTQLAETGRNVPVWRV